MQRISIVGLGTLGCSLGMALRSWSKSSAGAQGRGRASIEVAGFDFEQGVQKRAEKLGAVDRTYWSLPKTVSDAALVILAVPPSQLESMMLEIAPRLPEGCIVTDTTPHKQQSLAWASQHLPKHVAYVGGHPVLPLIEPDEPSADLLVQTTYALFPHENADAASTEAVVGLVQAVGAKPYFPDPAEHDAQVAATTLLPALTASALMHAASQGGGSRDLGEMAATDLAELTRLAATDPSELALMVQLGRVDAVRWLDSLISRLGELRALAARTDPEAGEQVVQFLTDAHNARENWLQPGANAGPPAERPSVSGQVNRLLFGTRRRTR